MNDGWLGEDTEVEFHAVSGELALSPKKIQCVNTQYIIGAAS
jgi:hypothetical protein